MKKFAIGTFSLKSFPQVKFAGLVIENKIYPISELAANVGVTVFSGKSVLQILEDWEQKFPIFETLIKATTSVTGYENIDLIYHPVVDLPRQVFCTGANYRKHVIDISIDARLGPEGLEGDALRAWAVESVDNRIAHGDPYVFIKPVTAVSGAYDDLVLPTNTVKPDWELELAVVIGKAGYNINESEAMDYVAGYTIANDISARDLIPRKDWPVLGTDWLRSKGQPGFLPLGPYFVPKCFVVDPYNLSLRLSVSGKVMQDECTSDMMFSIERQIAYISKYVKLLPGDIISTGSPAGNGTHYNRFLQDGDIVHAEISEIGHQRQVCVTNE